MSKRTLDIICEKVAEKLIENHKERLRGLPGKDGSDGPPGVPGMQGPMGMRGEDGYDPYRIPFNAECAEFNWKGVEFIIPFDRLRYSDVEPGVLTEDDARYIQVVHPELFDKIVLFWYRNYQFDYSKKVFYEAEDLTRP